jgi:hypothetical protein
VHHGGVADTTVTDWWDSDRVAALPPYLAESAGRRVAPATSRPAPVPGITPAAGAEISWVWLAGARPPTNASVAGLLTVSRRVELPPPLALSAVSYWWRTHETSPWIQAGRDRLELGRPDAAPMLGYLCRLFGRLHLHLTWPIVRVELDLSAWSITESQMELRPWRLPRGESRERRFFKAAHATIEELVSQVTRVVD